MTLKHRFILRIESVAFGGAGVGRGDGLVVFVPFTAPGDLVEIEMVERKKKFARGRLLKIVEPSPLRVEPLCRYYGYCGGCSYQHINYAKQLEIKQKQIRDAFLRIGGLAEPPVAEVIGSLQPYGYRGKARLHVRKTAAGPKIGFMDVTGGKIADIERCELMHDSINDQIRELKSASKTSAAEDDVLLWSDEPGSTKTAVVRRVKGREFWVPFAGFFQTNLYLTGTMVDVVCGMIGERKGKNIVDACCGAGLFSVFLAPYAERLTGIEIDKKSVKYARKNAERQGIRNTEFICGDIGEILNRLAQKKESADVILLDPPRAGLSRSAIASAAALHAREIIYVSCNPATQARDARVLNSYGYDLCELQPLDMFAQTEHVETVGRFEAR